jgi:alkanesulfonate monooxygenase SsuD/methylene tetrahydromethanopterin reductase-like flavin-dependent oxidoreductase (luciferase family)
MKLGFFTMPLHPASRPLVETLNEDRKAFILADRLGYSEAYMGEHVTDSFEPVPNSMMFLCWVAHEIKNMTLATGTLNLGHHHPAAVAAEAAMLDHMLEGRFMLGVSPGNLPSDSEVFGTLDIDRNEKFIETLDQIIEIWTTDPPYDIKGKYNSISTVKTYLEDLGQGVILKPYQKPTPPIFGTVVAPYSKGIVGLGERGWIPVSANFLQAKWAATHWPNYAEGCANVGREADPSQWRVARSIFVADDDKVAQEYGKGLQSPYRFYFYQLGNKLRRGGKLGLFKLERDQPDEEITVDFMVDSLVIAGTVDSVVDQLLAFREEVGDFGTLVYAGHDWVDRKLGERSMELMATEVMPRINKAIGSSGRNAAE